MVVGGLSSQPSAMFYVVPLAAALIAQRRRDIAQTVHWLAVHIGFIIASLGFAYCTMIVLYAAGVFVKSRRIAFEHHWGDKFSWFFHETMPNALSLFVLNDNNLRDHEWYIASAGLVGLLLIAGAVVEWRRHGRARGLIWAVALVGLPILAASVIRVASVRYATFRIIFSMTPVLLIFIGASARDMKTH